MALAVTVPCGATLAPGIGSRCGLDTTLDGGADGDVDTPDNGVFARQGIFVP